MFKSHRGSWPAAQQMGEKVSTDHVSTWFSRLCRFISSPCVKVVKQNRTPPPFHHHCCRITETPQRLPGDNALLSNSCLAMQKTCYYSPTALSTKPVRKQFCLLMLILGNACLGVFTDSNAHTHLWRGVWACFSETDIYGKWQPVRQSLVSAPRIHKQLPLYSYVTESDLINS